MSSYAVEVDRLRATGYDVTELRGPSGCLAVVPDAARLIAFAPTPDEPNVLWTGAPAGPGGERVWFAPEFAYFWTGEPDWASLRNYAVPASIDPGRYAVSQDDSSVTITGSVRLEPTAGGEPWTIELERRLRFTSPPHAGRGVRAVGVESAFTVRPIAGSPPQHGVGLWILTQVRPGGSLVVPLDGQRAEPAVLAYIAPGSWEEHERRVEWRYTGAQDRKIGISAQRLAAGRAAVLWRSGARSRLLVKDFDLDRAGRYVDHPVGVPRRDQALQAWDGLGFGEVEVHSTNLTGPRTIVDRLWAYEGLRDAIDDVMRALIDSEWQSDRMPAE